MKSPVLGLALSTIAFGASSIYLWRQLDEQHAQAEAVLAANAALNARIIELEKRRAELMTPPAPVPPGVVASSRGSVAPGVPPPPPDVDPVAPPPGADVPRRPEMPEAMRKMLRASMRGQQKRLYFDLQQKLGLTDAQTNSLLDLISAQSVDFGPRRGRDPQTARADWEAERERLDAAITDLLGPGKAAEFAEYQKTTPARSELLMISQQLEGADVPLSDSQRSRLLDALVAERERVPAPRYDSTVPTDFARIYGEWQDDYETRMRDAARSILTSDQLDTMSQFQQWQREMRQQFGNAPSGAGPRGMTPWGIAVAEPVSSPSRRPTDAAPNPK